VSDGREGEKEVPHQVEKRKERPCGNAEAHRRVVNIEKKQQNGESDRAKRGGQISFMIYCDPLEIFPCLIGPREEKLKFAWATKPKKKHVREKGTKNRKGMSKKTYITMPEGVQ